MEMVGVIGGVSVLCNALHTVPLRIVGFVGAVEAAGGDWRGHVFDNNISIILLVREAAH